MVREVYIYHGQLISEILSRVCRTVQQKVCWKIGEFFFLSNMLYHHFLLFLAKVWSGVRPDNVGDCKDLIHWVTEEIPFLK